MLALEHLPRDALAAVRIVAADIDGTVTTGGRITARTVAGFEALQESGCGVVLVTGRSAGWAAALAAYLPGLSGVVAENGAVLLQSPAAGDPTPVWLDPAVLDGSAPAVATVERCLEAVETRYPHARPGSDNFCRLSDRTVEVAPGIDPDVVAGIASSFGLWHTYSHVHHHLSRSSVTKRTGLLAALADVILPGVMPAREVVTIGDSVNDAPLFDAATFAATVGVRGVTAHLGALGGSVPSYVTSADGGLGFDELATVVLTARRAAP